MSEPYLSEIRMFAGNYAPSGWALCQGQLLAISDNDALFALLGTTYGGDGITTFGLPDLRGRLPIHPYSSYPIGALGGTEQVILTAQQLPTHTHTANAVTAAGDLPSPSNAYWASSAYFSNGKDSNGNPIPLVPMNPQLVTSAGGSQPHDNMMPSLTVSFIIALNGVYPPQS